MKRIFKPFAVLALLLGASAHAEDISGPGWRLWLDTKAEWKNDSIYLPSEMKLEALPVNAPSGGWKALDIQAGIPVTLPTTVEEHYWGKLGTRPYALNEAQRGKDTTFPIGNYLGVSWWWKSIQAPKFSPGQRLIARFRGARLRAEVYANGRLCGYNILTELPFEADLTDAVKSGEKAQLALRITNPGGHLDWIDFSEMHFRWGKYTLPPSRGFGGLDAGIELEVRDDASVSDLAVLNKPDLRQVRLIAGLKSLAKPFKGPLRFEISRKGKVVWNGEAEVELAAGEQKNVSLDATVPSAEPWDLKNPRLYQASASLGTPASARTRDFGFRFFTAEGIGSEDAKLTLNGKRVVLISAISWGFWGRNGLWPDQEMADREMKSARELGMNCLHFHRNVGKTLMLELSDRQGLLRFEEPGGGKFALGARYAKGPFPPDGSIPASAFDPKEGYKQPDSVDTSGQGEDGDPQLFWEKYEEEKILAMVKRDRSHPSLVIYNIQNESDLTDLRNPRIYRLFRRMHELDPSRPITLYSGGVPKDNQVLMLPYSDEIRYGSKTQAFAGWRDVHTCGGPTNYMDHLYKDPRHFFQRVPEKDRKSVAVWGEMLGSGCPDDYEKLVNAFTQSHPHGYELDDAKKVLKGYNDYLDKWGYRKAFPTASSLFRSIGSRTYYFWQRILAQSRADNANDMLVVSGWESTSIDNHSGLVDNHRQPKSDPALLAQSCKEELILIQPRQMIPRQCSKAVVDLFLINETGRKGPQNLKFRALRPDKSVAFEMVTKVAAVGGETYGQLLVEGIAFVADAPGLMDLEVVLTGATVLKARDQIHVVPSGGAPLLEKIAVWEPGTEVAKSLKGSFGVSSLRLTETADSEALDAVVLAANSKEEDLGLPKEALEKALERVKRDGTRLVLWPDHQMAAEQFAKQLARRGIVNFQGMAGNLGAPWFGSWFFARKHWLLEGLPADCSLDWRYGISAFGGPAWLQEDPKGSNTDGLMIEAPGMESFVGYGADHNPKVGTAGLVLPHGKGQIVLYCLPQLLRSLQPGSFAIGPVISQHLLANALRQRGKAAALPDPKNPYYCDPALLKAQFTPVPTPASEPSKLDLKLVQPGMVISVDFRGGSPVHGTPKAMGKKEVAGAVPAAYWNNAAEASGKLKKLKDGAGRNSGASVVWESRNNWSNPVKDEPGGARMMKGYLDSSDTTAVEVKVEGLSKAFTEKGYRVLVYFDGDETEDRRTATYSIGEEERVGTDPGNSFFKGVYAHAWDKEAATDENYVVLEGLKEASFTLKALPLDSNGPHLRAPVSGFQIVAEP